MTDLRLHLDAAICVVAAFSTVVVEAALMGKPSLLVGFGQSSHGSAMVNYHFELEHMTEVTTWPGVRLCNTRDELLHMCSAYLQKKVACTHSQLNMLLLNLRLVQILIS